MMMISPLSPPLPHPNLTHPHHTASPIKARAQAESESIRGLCQQRDALLRGLHAASHQDEQSKHRNSTLRQELQILESEERALADELSLVHAHLRQLRKEPVIPGSSSSSSSSSTYRWLLLLTVFLLMDIFIVWLLYDKYRRHLIRVEQSIWTMTGMPSEETVWSWLFPHRRRSGDFHRIPSVDIPM